jgi:hypothetical protein
VNAQPPEQHIAKPPKHARFDAPFSLLWTGISAIETLSVYNAGCPTSQSVGPGESHIMNKHRNFRICVRLGFFLAFAGSLSAQNTPNKTLVVNGKSVDAPVLQIGGHSYIDVESLAQVTNGTVFIEPNRVVLTIPVAKSTAAPRVADTVAAQPAAATTAAVTAPAAAPAVTASGEPVAIDGPAPAIAPAAAQPAVTASVAVATPADASAPAAAATTVATSAAAAPVDAPAPVQPPSGLSRAFAVSAIAALADLREWRGAISAMITHGLAISDNWAQGYRDEAQSNLGKAEVAARTDDDRNALALLQNEAGSLTAWWDGVLAARQDLNGATTIDPDALKNDTALAKIRTCSQFLNSMLVSGAFSDDASCH